MSAPMWYGRKSKGGNVYRLMLTKIQRVKEIEDLGGATLVSEGIDANYMDIINYAVFGVIKLTYGE